MDQLNLFQNSNNKEAKETKEVKEVVKVIKFPVEKQEVKKEEPQEQEENTSSINMIELKAVRKPTKINQSTKIRNPQHARDIINELYDLENIAEEQFIMLALDSKNYVIGSHLVSHGNLNSSIVHPREVFKRAFLNNAAAIIVAHNHPSGNIKPSKEDIKATQRLAEVGEIIGIELLDHLIIGYNDRMLSLRNGGYFDSKAQDLL